MNHPRTPDENQDMLRQQLLELHYDLLDDETARRLRAAIQTDPEVATLWASTLRLAGKFADAAKIEGSLPKFDLAALVAPPHSNGSVNPQDKSARHSDTTPLVVATLAATEDPATGDPAVGNPAPKSHWIAISSMCAATAAALGMLVIGSWYLERIPNEPATLVRVEATPMLSTDTTSENEFRLVTTRVDSAASAGRLPVTPAALSFSVLARNTVLFSGATQTDAGGTGRITLPDELVIPKDAKLRITASSIDGEMFPSSIEVPLEPTRCLTYVVVDRPVYRPGEIVLFRSLTLQRKSLRVNSDVPIRFELIDPSGAMVPGAFIEGVTDRGVGNGSFLIPSTAPGGPYTLVAKSLDGFFPEERCEFQVRAYRVPRIKKELEFRRRSYGPGETVQADFSAIAAEGGPVAGAAVSVTATVDDEVIYRDTQITSADGTCVVSFTLPSLIREGAGQLSVSVDDGGTRETKSKTIPIQLGRVEVDFYPEGGYLVDGLKNRIYFAARDTLGNPIEVAGEVQSRNGQSVAKIQTTRDGMGKFEFVPVAGERYALKVTQPADVTNSPSLPSVVKNLPVIDTGKGVFEPERPITMLVRSMKPMEVRARAVCRGQLVGEAIVSLRSGVDHWVSVPAGRHVSGVIRVTIFDNSVKPAQPLMERLVFRRPNKNLSVEIVDQQSALQQSPGQPVRLSVQVRDETGEPVPAMLGISVVDDASLSLEDHERPGLQTHFLLTSEVEKPEDLEHANFYLDETPEAAESLDLLLGTQGWRRFIRGDASANNVDFREQLVRLIELDGAKPALGSLRFDSGGNYRQRWLGYRASVHSAWQRLLVETKILVLAVLLLWLFSIVIHLRRNMRVSVASWMLVASASACFYGCGTSTDGFVVSSPASDASQIESAKESINEMPDMEMMMDEAGGMMMDGVPALEPADSVKTEPSATEVLPSQSGSAGSDVEKYAPGSVMMDDDERLNSRSLAIGTNPRGNAVSHQNRSIGQADLERLLAARGLDATSLADELLAELRFPVRQYAHRHVPSDSGLRQDFTETLYWQPMLMTDSQGRASIRFDLSDSVTTFRVNVDGHTSDGRIGSGGGEVISRLPFQIEPKMPLEVTTGDLIKLPIAVINATDQDAEVGLSVRSDPALSVEEDSTRVVSLDAGQRRREHVVIDVLTGSGESDAAIEIRGTSSAMYSDSIRRTLHVAPQGYPARRSIAGRLSQRSTIQLPIPSGIVTGSLAVTVRAYPSPIADVMSGVESILREPHGCFEQTSATNYPNTMALTYLQESQAANPDVSRKAIGMLDRGYGKLISFECQQRGYEWFGSDPGHEALSAFGLMQFTDMSKVMEVSQEMMVRTRQWLLSRRDGQGGFQRNPRHLHVWSVQQPVVNAYVLWALSEADRSAGNSNRAASELSAELDQMALVAKNSSDPYLVALSAATLMNVSRTDEGSALLQRLTEMQKPDGSLQGQTTVTSSGGLSLTMETTAIAALAWIKSPQYVAQARSATQWIQSNRVGDGGFGSTQATVLALKALVALSGHSQTKGGGTLEVRLAGNVIGEAKLPIEPQSGSTVEIVGLGSQIESAIDDQTSVEIELVGRGVENLSFTVEIQSHVVTPETHPDCPITMTTELTGPLAQDASVTAGELLQVATRVTNRTGQGQPMTVAVVGLPGGVEPRTEELDELKESGRFDYYEIRGREVVFYWRTIEPNAVKEIDFHVTAAIPGRYTGPASRTYLYYTAEQKHWIEPMKVTIEP